MFHSLAVTFNGTLQMVDMYDVVEVERESENSTGGVKK
jgi:hypothetical protein